MRTEVKAERHQPCLHHSSSSPNLSLPPFCRPPLSDAVPALLGFRLTSKALMLLRCCSVTPAKKKSLPKIKKLNQIRVWCSSVSRGRTCLKLPPFICIRMLQCCDLFFIVLLVNLILKSQFNDCKPLNPLEILSHLYLLSCSFPEIRLHFPSAPALLMYIFTPKNIKLNRNV